MTSLLRKSAVATAGAAMVAFGLAALVPASNAQDGPAAKAKTKAKTQKKAAAAEAESSSKAVRRVPMYFGGLDLTDAQKESIYALETDYQPRIQELERQADELRDRLTTECEAVLTAPQKQALAEARESAAARRKAGAVRRKAEAEPAEEKPAPKAKAKGETPARKPATIE